MSGSASMYSLAGVAVAGVSAAAAATLARRERTYLPRGHASRVRLFGVPENRRAVRRAFWRELHAAGADLIGARDLGSLRRLLRAQRAPVT